MKKYGLVLTLILTTTIVSYGQTDEKRPDNQSTLPTENGEVWYKVDVLPTYPGGISKFIDYVSDNLKYPQDAKKKRIEGKVIIEFVVDSTGVIRKESISVTKGLYKSCDEEAIRVIKQCPNWIPGRVTELNKNVPVKMVVPITFKR